MFRRIPVCIYADDPISHAGVASQLRPQPEVLVLGDDERGRAEVALVVTERVTGKTLELLRSLSRTGTARSVLVAGHLRETELRATAQAGIAGLVNRPEATVERLVSAISAAVRGDGAAPADPADRVRGQACSGVTRLRQTIRTAGHTALADREVQVLRLVADGFDTAQIAQKLSYSPRTVKNVLHDVTSRLHLNNRSHAVAYALRQGLI